MPTTFILDQPVAVAAWVAHRIPHLRDALSAGATPFGVVRPGEPLPFQAIGVARDGEPIAGMVAHNWRRHGPGRNDVELSFAVATPGRWATRGVIRALLTYPFRTLDCGRATTVVGASNAACRRLMDSLGFQQEGLHRRGLDGIEDAITYGLLRDDAARWLGG